MIEAIEAMEAIEATEETEEIGQESTDTGTVVHTAKRKQSGLARLFGISSLVMAMTLPIGVVPRMIQARELDQKHEQIEKQLPVVSAARAKVAPAQRSISLPGTIEAITETPIYARTSGYVSQRFADIGDRVTAGQLLAHIDTPDVDQSSVETAAQVLTNIAGKAQSEANRDRARADYDKARADLSQAKANVVELESNQNFALTTYQRFKKLGAEGAVSAQDVDEKETRYTTSTAATEAGRERVRAAQSEVIAARARVQAEVANVNVSDANILAARARAGRSTTEKNFQNVLSPFAGVITERTVDNGTLVTSGSENSKLSLYKVARIDTVKVFVDVPQYVASGITIGQPVQVTLKEESGKVYTGRVARTSVALDPTARTLRTEIHVPNSDFALSPGMYADVAFSVKRPGQIFLIPANSLVISASGTQLVTVTRDKRVHYTRVKLGEDLGSEIEVVAGLTGREVLVLNPPDSLSEGTIVQTDSQQTASVQSKGG